MTARWSSFNKFHKFWCSRILLQDMQKYAWKDNKWRIYKLKKNLIQIFTVVKQSQMLKWSASQWRARQVTLGAMGWGIINQLPLF
jgi:hypothetical protein